MQRKMMELENAAYRVRFRRPAVPIGVGSFVSLNSCGSLFFPLLVTGNGNGVVTSQPEGVERTPDNRGISQNFFIYGPQLALTATARAHWQGDSWQGCDSTTTEGLSIVPVRSEG